jgi:hypothetical protein
MKDCAEGRLAYLVIFGLRLWDCDFLERVVHFARLALNLFDGDGGRHRGGDNVYCWVYSSRQKLQAGLDNGSLCELKKLSTVDKLSAADTNVASCAQTDDETEGDLGLFPTDSGSTMRGREARAGVLKRLSVIMYNYYVMLCRCPCSHIPATTSSYWRCTFRAST